MRRFELVAILLAACGLLVACESSAGPPGAAGASGSSRTSERPEPVPGSTWYTQFTLQYERDLFRTTNYRRGFVLPINTEVVLTSIDSDEIEVEVKDSGRRLVVQNVPKHTNETTGQAFAKLFGAAPVDLSDFTDEEQAAIQAGRAEVGMSREAIIAAIGYPPAVGTPTLETNPWKYWDSRFTTFLVRFDDGGHVVEVAD